MRYNYDNCATTIQIIQKIRQINEIQIIQLNFIQKMQNSSKFSLAFLQEQIHQELNSMPKNMGRGRSNEMRNTICCTSSKKVKNQHQKMLKNKSVNLSSQRKREYSLTSTRIPESYSQQYLQNRDSVVVCKNKKPVKIGEKSKLRKKMSKQYTPKPFLKLKRGDTLPEQSQAISSTTRFLRQTSPERQKVTEKGYLQPWQYQKTIQKQRQLIEQLQKIIESMGQE